MPQKRRARGAERGHRRAPPAQRGEPIVTTFRIYADQRDALQREALRRRAAGGKGRLDASAVLRELLDAAGMKGPS